MPKGRSHGELYLAFHAGLTPKDLIAKGYPKWSVYNYLRKYNKIIEPSFKELLLKPSIETEKRTAKETNGVVNANSN